MRRLPPPDERRLGARSTTPSWSWALTMNRTSDSSSQPTTASATHLSTRPGVMRPGSRGSRGARALVAVARERSRSALEVAAFPRRNPPRARAVDLVLGAVAGPGSLTRLCI